MPSSPAVSRRERNKQDKRDRIATAARQLFSRHGFDEVTTQQVAEQADVGAGTVFLYAKNKGELLLLVQNSDYAQSLARAIAAASYVADTVGAVSALVRPIVGCYRKRVDNGRTYLREVVFGDHTEPHHERALTLTMQTEAAVTDILAREDGASADPDRAVQAHIVTSIMFLAMAVTANAGRTVEDLMEDIRHQIAVLLQA